MILNLTNYCLPYQASLLPLIIDFTYFNLDFISFINFKHLTVIMIIINYFNFNLNTWFTVIDENSGFHHVCQFILILINVFNAVLIARLIALVTVGPSLH